MLPRWLCTVALVTLAQVAAQPKQDDNVFMNAMKNLLFGADPANASAHIAQPEMHPHTFHQYNAVARSNQPSGQSCTLPQQIGTGPYRIPRWYFNPARGRCELFYWSGCCGNGNNFQTFQSCQTVCEVSNTPSYLSPPLLAPSLRQEVVIIANAPTEAACGCCLQPFSSGYGNQLLPKYYYNMSAGLCLPFYYRGYGGFGNVFESDQQCRQKCLVDSSLSVNIIQTVATPCPTVPTTLRSTRLPSPPPPPPPTTPAVPVDPCSQDKESGVGAVQLSRYYFNKALGICEQFTYFGSGGNRNQFQTLEECQAQCPETPNPCAVAVSGPLVPCSPGANRCAVGQFCHVGDSAQTTVCCPKPSPLNKCQQPLNIGIGNANLQRWYFNPLTQQCQQCVYRGLQGNENNFLSRQDCEGSCLVNPCKLGTPFRSQGVTVQCSAANPTVCPAGYYCHVGADMSTSVCCQALGGSPCEQSMTKGEGPSALTRFYYDMSQRKCLAFNYLGEKGNQNNFLTKESCESICPVWVNPCAVGVPVLTVEQKPFHCHQGASCGAGYYCHIGYDDATTACCPSEGDPCTQEVKEGTGHLSISRWFYNQNTRQCQPFTYRGLGGNENNFLLREHCESTCPVWINACPTGEPYLLASGKPQPCDPVNDDSCPMTHWCHPGPDVATTMCCPGRSDPCIHAKSEGEGPLSLTRFYFDATVRQCVDFSYKGLKGNANNFLTKEDCEAKCPVQINPCPISFSSLRHSVQLVACSATFSCPEKQWCHVGETKETTVCCPNAIADPCKAPARNPGIGEFQATRWAFEPSTRKCVPFEYRGMKGNANNFVTRESCEKRCPVFENPCKVGEPFVLNAKYFTCSENSPCPNKYYCHIGEESNYCCQTLGPDPCMQALDRGVGNTQLSRWFWNAQGQCCQPFSYCGQRGTQNNFLSKQDCERTCYELDNPCALGEPQLNPDNRPVLCTAQQQNTCGASFWCHIGASSQTTLCCPGRVEGPEICQQPLAVGEGGASLARFYYDPTTMSCKPFTYQGRYGNQNNFLDLQSCEQTCPVYVNVCPTGSPLIDKSTNKPVPCTFGVDSCGPSHWCHLGLIPAEYQCCPGEPAVPGACQGLPDEVGVPGAPAPPATRYYYDQSTMTCVQFIYNGRKGNQNNFLTKEDCETTCEVFTNPCNQPIPLPPTTCSGPGTCGGSTWCHIGATPETTVCCPSEGNPCVLPLAPGTGNQFMDRWYFNQQSGTCQSFTYAGLHGNQNNFLTQQSCEEQCGPNPCFEGKPFAGVDGRAQTCSASANLNTCPLNHWCHIGSDMSTTVCCPGASTNVCNLPMSTGEGNARLDRFYFDQSTKQCRPFVYNGLKGNQNNFVTLRACQLACQPLDNPCIGQPATTAAGQVLFCSYTNRDQCPVNFWCHIGATPETTVCCPGATNPCSVPLAPGTGNSGLNRWYYNPDDRQCLPFQYNGKRGNQNNFQTQAECERTCPVFTNPCNGEVSKDADGEPKTCNPMKNSGECARGYFCLAGDPMHANSSYCCPRTSRNLCETPLNVGTGEHNHTRYFYSANEGDCFPFFYKGLHGNENNFLTRKLCQEKCKPLANVCFGGERPLANGSRIIQCHTNRCPSTHYCHMGTDARSTLCCPKKGPVCDQQFMPGVGDHKIARYYYDAVEDICLPFNYTGLAGNENNFLTKAQCQITCPGFRGYCPHGKPHIANGTSVTTCGIDMPCPRDHLCHVSKRESKSVCCPDPANFCLMPKDSGPCGLKQNRYYYDREAGVCKKFSYGGCQGNLNNFDTIESCTEICCDKGYY